jgi:hypothetical protein
MKKALMLMGLAVLVLGCAPVTVAPVVTGGDRAAGTVDLMYTHRSRDNVDLNAAQADAISRCQAWGYQSAELFPVKRSTCIQPSDYGCMRYRSELEAQCLGDLET